ncbi:MAG: RNA 2',3'-cyclic phosphodiesterase [Sulfuritalea sp.]|nr:RNA 2',3'-cyclic phosphodiesterase [Sulfuritalea sp.]
MGEARPHRVFFALWPDAAAVTRLAALAPEMAGADGRAMLPATLHMTLAFVGAVTAAELGILADLGATVHGEAFDLSLDHLGFFPRGGIAWAGCRQTPSRQRRLSGQLCDALRGAGFAIDPRAGQVPHVTLARRVRSPSLPPLETPIVWRASEFALVESHLHPSAASYRTLARFSLAEARTD